MHGFCLFLDRLFILSLFKINGRLTSPASNNILFQISKKLDQICRQGRLEEARKSLAWLREGESYLEEEHEILEVDAFYTFINY